MSALLVSDRLAYMTGHALVLDGGVTASMSMTSAAVALAGGQG